MKKCPHCNKIYTDNDYYCLRDNHRLVSYTNEECYSDQVNRQSKTSPQDHNTPNCPTCGSTNIKKISSLSKAVHGLAFGLFSTTARSQFECNNCKYKW